MRFRILGPLEIRDSEGNPVLLRAPKQRTLLAVLLLHANRPVSVDRLESAVWPDKPPRSAAGVIKTYVSGLRNVLWPLDGGDPTRLVREPSAYRLLIEPDDLDLAVFEELSARGRDALNRGDVARAARLLSDALALWRGDPAVDVTLDGDSTAALAIVAERRLVTEEAWADAQLALGSDDDLIGRLRVLAAEQPLRERVRGQLMQALYRAGRKAEALAEFRELRQALDGELGIEPSAPVQELHRRILEGDPALAPRPAAVHVPRQLPRDTGSFTGRDVQLAALRALLHGSDTVIATITGMAGVGKTALAVHFAHQVAERFPDGQLCVDLHGHADTAPMAPAEALRRFLRALGVREVPGDTDEAAALYRTLLAGKRLLVLLDNAATASQIRPLLPGTSGCLVVVTSRSRLAGLLARDSATPITLEPLTESESGILFRKVLCDARADADPAAMTTVVARCAGLPLALRIAAERAAYRPRLALPTLASELMAEPRGLDMLAMDGDGHTTVRSVFSWSYRGLAPDVARMFRLLGVHPGLDVSIPAAAALAGSSSREAGRTLETLAGVHLAAETAPGRYRCHDLLRTYAVERACHEETPAARAAALRRVLTWYLHTADAANRVISLSRHRPPLDPVRHVQPLSFTRRGDAQAWCEAEFANLAVITQRAAEAGLTDFAWKIPAAMADFFRLRRPWDHWISCCSTGLAAARRAGDLLGQAWSLDGLGTAYFQAERFADATDCYEESLALFEKLGDPRAAETLDSQEYEDAC